MSFPVYRGTYYSDAARAVGEAQVKTADLWGSLPGRAIGAAVSTASDVMSLGEQFQGLQRTQQTIDAESDRVDFMEQDALDVLPPGEGARSVGVHHGVTARGSVSVGDAVRRAALMESMNKAAQAQKQLDNVARPAQAGVNFRAMTSPIDVPAPFVASRQVGLWDTLASAGGEGSPTAGIWRRLAGSAGGKE